jgi:hypothetical protein
MDDRTWELAKNLASLNEIVAEMVTATADDHEFAELVRNTLRDHSWAMGFEFQGQRPPADPEPQSHIRAQDRPGWDEAVREAKPAAKPRKWAVWSWDERNRTWMAVAEGSEKNMTEVLARKQSAAARLLPSARFAMTPKSQPPQEAPES